MSGVASPMAGLTIRPAAECRFDLLALGEVMLRFDPGERRISHARQFTVWEGGGEYNVARGLRRCFGHRSGIITALVDNPVGRLVEDLMLQGGVDLSHVHWRSFDGIGREARNGVYFLERGFGVRGAMGMMDRGGTAISQLRPEEIDWDGVFGRGVAGLPSGTRWFHTGGIMAALSESSTAVVKAAMQTARGHGAIVSFDCNYRPSLWKERGGREGSVQVNRELIEFVDVLFGHEGDLLATLGEASHGPVWHTAESYAPMAERVMAEFGHLKVIASTVRRPHTASRNGWGAFAFAEGKVHEGMRFDELDIFDRVGGGDSFASGLIHGLSMGRGIEWAVDCGVAHGALAMTTAGDGSMVSAAEVERLMGGGSAGVQR